VDPVPVSSEYRLLPPFEGTVGASVNLWILTGTAEATYVDYSETMLTGGTDIPEESEINKRIKEELTRVVNLNVGAEFRIPFTGLSARAGAMYRPSPYKADPSRYDQKFVTLGLGINSSDRLHFDIGYLYRWNDTKKDETRAAHASRTARRNPPGARLMTPDANSRHTPP
jgi:long-subunit fatty acid transport protein